MKFFPRLQRGHLGAYGPLVWRLLLGFHLIHGTQDNVFSWARMLEFRDFLAAHRFPVPLVCAVISVAAQFVCGGLYLVGWYTRLAASVMAINFTVALGAVHLGRPYPEAFPALVMWLGSIALWLTGPGKWALDNRRDAAATSAD